MSAATTVQGSATHLEADRGDADSAQHQVTRTCTELTSGARLHVQEVDPRPLSAYRSAPAYVLLGDPGSGKTTEFHTECDDLEPDAAYVTARDFIRLDLDSHPEWRDTTLFIDGLDEMRADSTDARSPLDEIRARIEKLGRPNFRLSCREADWLGPNDRRSLETVAPDSRITVLLLNPLSDQNIRELVAQQVDETTARAFESEARKRGLGGMLRNPQALKLLLAAVDHAGSWPNSRLGTFESACKHMASEHNNEHWAAGAPHDADAIMDAAGRLSALLLLGGFEGYRLLPAGRTAAPQPGFVLLRDVTPQAHDLHRGALSRLFVAVGEGEFKPRHRQEAEFLAGRWLATLVDQGLPASRIVALMASPGDGRVVTPLRGLSAWLAAHSAEARQELIEADPVGVGLYGDIAGFHTEDKKRLLMSLVSFATEGPLFGHEYYDGRMEGFGDGTAWAFRSLASADTVEAIQSLLKQPLDEAHQNRAAAFVLEVLARIEDAQKPSLGALLSTLQTVLNDPATSDAAKTRALNALIHLAPQDAQSAQMLIGLLDAIHDGVLTDPDDQMRGSLLRHLYPRLLPPARLWHYLVPPGNPRVIGSNLMFWKRRILKRSSDEQVAELLDALCRESERFVPVLRNSLLDDLPVSLLARGLEAFGDTLEFERLFRWLSVAAETGRAGYRREGGAHLVREWLEQRPDVQEHLFLAWLRESVTSGSESYLHYLSCDALRFSRQPADFGWRCLKQAVLLADSEPAVAGHLLEEAFRSRDDPTTGKGLTLDVMRERIGTSPLAHRLDELCERSARLRAEEDDRQQEMEALEAQRAEEERQLQDSWAEGLRAHLDDLLDNSFAAPDLDTLAQVHLGMFMDLDRNATPQQRLHEFIGGHEELLEPVIAAIRGAISRDDVPSVAETMTLHGQSKRSWMAYPVLASLHLLEDENSSQLDQIDDNRKREALAIRFCVGTDITPGRWHFEWFEQDPGLVLDVLCHCAVPSIRRGDRATVCLNTLNSLPDRRDLVHGARLRLIDAIPLRATTEQMDLLDDLLSRAVQHPDKAPILELSAKKLSLKSLAVAQRVRWLSIQALLAPNPDMSELSEYVSVNERRLRHLAEFLRRLSRPHDTGRSLLVELRDPEALRHVIEMLGPAFPPAYWESGFVSLGMDTSDLIGHLINQLGTVPGDDVHRALAEMADDPRLGRWRDWLTGAQERQRVVNRDALYRHPSIDQLQRTLDDGEPANAADLAALLADRIEEISKQLRGDNSNPWRQFWADDREHPPTQPKHEDSCRDALLTMFGDRLPPSVEAIPEGRYAADTRADISVRADGFNVPIEIKKNSHPDLWHALRKQLIAQYTSDPTTSGFGIYLVLWFGASDTKRPPDGQRPESPEALRQRLMQQLTPDEARKISVIVLDVTKPSVEPV